MTMTRTATQLRAAIITTRARTRAITGRPSCGSWTRTRVDSPPSPELSKQPSTQVTRSLARTHLFAYVLDRLS